MALVHTLEGEDEELMQVTGSGKGEEADSEMFRGGIHRPLACEGESRGGI